MSRLLRLLARSVAPLTFAFALAWLTGAPAAAQLDQCTFRGTHAQEFYGCAQNIDQFTAEDHVFRQGNRPCVWVSAGVAYHFTTATNADGDFHVTFQNDDDRRCFVDIVADQRCSPTLKEAECTGAQHDLAQALCTAFVTTAQCSGEADIAHPEGDATAKQSCYSARDCEGKVLNHRDAHNCKRSGGKSWRSPYGTCYNL